MSKKIKYGLFIAICCLSVMYSVVYMIEQKQKNKVENEIVKEEVIEEEIIEEEIIEEEKLVSLGNFKLTAYCPCQICCGKWAGGNTASGTRPTANRTIAVDTSVIPFGTEVIINGITYVAEDTGSAINGNKIDVYMDSHEAALQFGIQYAEVFVLK